MFTESPSISDYLFLSLIIIGIIGIVVLIVYKIYKRIRIRNSAETDALFNKC